MRSDVPHTRTNREAPPRLDGEPQNRRMRMTFRRALTVGGVAALLASAIAVAGAGAGPDATPPGKGKAGALGVCGLGNGKKATGAPLKLAGLDMLIPGVVFTTLGK